MKVGISCSVLLWLCLLAGGAHAYELKKTDKGVPVRWKRLPMRYSIDAEGLGDYFTNRKEQGAPESEFQAVAISFVPWQGITCGGLAAILKIESRGKVPGQQIGYDQQCNGCNTNLIKFILTKEAWRHDQTQLAVTTLSFNQNDGEILDADMEINAGHFELSTQTDNQELMRWDIQNTVTHEVGHMLGLGHSLEPSSTMFASGQQKEITKRDLAADDKLGICALYPPQQINVPSYKQTQVDRALGCSQFSASGSTFSWLGLLLLAVLGVLRRRRA